MLRTFVGRGSGIILVFFLIAACAALSFFPYFEVDAGTKDLLNEDDPDLAYYNLTRADWGYDEYAILCIRKKDWFTPEAVASLTALVERLEKIPHVKSTTSLFSVPLLRNGGPILFGFPTLKSKGVNLEKAREEFLDHTQARGNLISVDEDTGMQSISILVNLDVPERMLELEPQWARAQARKDREKISELRQEYESVLAELKTRRAAMIAGLRKFLADTEPAGGWPEGEGMWLSGLPHLNISLIEHIDHDIRVFGIASFAFFTLAFLAIYRKPRWTLGPILTCVLPVVLIVGAMAFTGKKVTVITSNLPVLLFVLMLPYTVYFVERYRERRALFASETNEESTLGAASEVFVPCLFSCTTTMAGFASLLTSGINPVRTFGLMMVIGMAVGLATVFLFLPSLVKSLRPLEGTASASSGEPRGVVRAFAETVLGSPAAVVVASLLLMGAAIWGITKIEVETKFTDYFWPSSEVYQGLETVDRQIGGTTPLEVFLTSEEPGYFKTEEGLDDIAAAAGYFDDLRKDEQYWDEAGRSALGNVRSLKTLVDEIRKSPFLRNAKLDRLAKIKAAKELTTDFVNEDFTVTRVLVRFRETHPKLHRNNILAGLREHLAKQESLKKLKPRATGVFLLYANMLNSLVESQKETFLWVVLAIFAMLLVLFRSPGLALVVLVPQVLPALVCLGTMGWMGIPLDLVTVMIASIAMGVGIDSAIQYTVRYRRELEATGGDRRAAVRRAHATIGRAIWIATSVVVLGFIVLVLSAFVPTVKFGAFTALAMLMGQFASLTLLPSLFLLTGFPRSVDKKAAKS